MILDFDPPPLLLPPAANAVQVLFFQDTNGLVFKSLPALLGVSVQNQFEVNTLSVPRQPGEAVGCISRLVPTSDAVQELTLNVEYSEIDALLKVGDVWSALVCPGLPLFGGRDTGLSAFDCFCLFVILVEGGKVGGVRR